MSDISNSQLFMTPFFDLAYFDLTNEAFTSTKKVTVKIGFSEELDSGSYSNLATFTVYAV